MTRRTWYTVMNALVVAWLIAAGVIVVVHRFVPAGAWLMIHLLLLGAISTAILVWSQHFADTLTRRPPPGGRPWHAARLAAHTLGAALVVAGMTAGQSLLVLIGGALVALNALAHGATLALQTRGALPARFAPLVRYYVAAAGVFVLGAALGVLLTQLDLDDRQWASFVLAHLAVNLLGWIGLTVLGTVVLLWPTVVHTRVTPGTDAAARRALPILVLTTLVAGSGALTGILPLAAVGVLGYLAGAGMLVVEWARQARSAPPSSYASLSIGAAVGWLLACAAALGTIVALTPEPSDALRSVQWLIAPFTIGFAAQVLLGAMSHLLPVVLGGGPASGRIAANELDRGALYRVLTTNAGIVVYLLPVPSLVKVVVSLVVFGVLVSFLVLAVRALAAARRLRTAPAAASSPPASTGMPRSAAKTGEAPQIVAFQRTGREADAVARNSITGSSGVGSPGAGTPVARTRSGAVVAAIGTLALAVIAGIALDPASAGLGVIDTAEVTPTGETTTVEVSMKNMRFNPGEIEVPAGDRLVIVLTNDDDTIHDLVLENGVDSGRVQVGDTVTVDVGIIGQDLDAWCSVAGHRQMGMVMTVIAVGADARGVSVGDGSSGDGSSSGDSDSPDHQAGHGSSGEPGARNGNEESAAADVDLRAEPGDDFDPYDARLVPTPAATTHRVTLRATDALREVAPGVTQRLWTFNGTAPGPVLRGKVGDAFEITLINDGTIGHSVDFHAGQLAPNRAFQTIDPGEELTFTFTAERAGIWLYHCATDPMSLHIANGMFGAVIIDPPGLVPVDREYLLVQSEFYLGPQNDIADPTRIASQHPDLVAFNGYAAQYRHAPLAAKTAERVRVWVLDAGPNRPSSFHVIGAQFDTVFVEGDYLLRNGGSTGVGGAQALALMSAQGGFVEMTFAEAGEYPFVTHIVSDAEKGAAGLFRVTR
ncbi:multicopper oxidase domain-containing protein [Ruicaihuangia caeni]|uniref:multicopper oxidase domain-containing protein n=1 Tax=Ruicaihuangia caeni TaxID=3042517 RepID=UPI0033900FD2